MNKTTVVMALALILPMTVAQASDMDDITMEVVESNDPSAMMNDIALPDVQKDVESEQEHALSSRDDSLDDVKQEMENEVEDTRSEIENEVEDTKVEIETEVEHMKEQATSDDGGS